VGSIERVNERKPAAIQGGARGRTNEEEGIHNLSSTSDTRSPEKRMKKERVTITKNHSSGKRRRKRSEGQKGKDSLIVKKKRRDTLLNKRTFRNEEPKEIVRRAR